MEFSRNILFSVFIFLVWEFCTAKIDRELDDKFKLFKMKFSRKYKNSTEEQKRKMQFKKIDQIIIKHNKERIKGKPHYNMSHNEFSDRFENEINKMFKKVNYEIQKSKRYSTEELKCKLQFKETEQKVIKHNQKRHRRHLPTSTPVPDSFNWLEKGWNTPVQHQGNCASGYAFVAVGTIEAAHFKKTGEYIKLSEQDVLDCSYQFDTKGCDGGKKEDAFNYIASCGVSLEQNVPYKAEQEIYCIKSGYQTYIRKFQRVEHGNEAALKEAVATYGPVAATMALSSEISFLQVSPQGIYYDPYCDQPVSYHDIIIVGYGREGGFDYWLAKNSFGTAWGNQGYFKIIRNINHCGIANFAAFPVL